MFEDLGKLIVAVQTNYDRICNIWTDKSELQINAGITSENGRNDAK